MKHLYKCSGNHLFLSEMNDIEAGCNVVLPSPPRQRESFPNGFPCCLMGWHQYEDCKCSSKKETQ